MNHIYRLIWNQLSRAWVAVSETAKGRGKCSSATVVLALIGVPAWAQNTLPSTALPTGGRVTAGQASISQTSNALTVLQQSQRAALDWQSFNIGAAATVNFNQPSINSVALNRIAGNSASEIYGKLNANGQVFFSNPNGLLFAKDSQVNVGGILATTMNLGNDDFMAGNYQFTNPGVGAIRNDGLINALGSVALVGNSVQNTGQIIATSATLAAGNTVAVDLTSDGLIRARVQDAGLQASIENSGSIAASSAVTLSAGQAKSTLERVVNNSGLIRATGLVNQGGEILLEGAVVENTGTITASGTNGGGHIQLMGDMAGGTVRVGGTLDASAPGAGDGGFIETSAAHVQVADTAHITTAATNGKAGMWLLDPYDFTIAPTTSTISDVTGAALSTALNLGAVTIQTTSALAPCIGVICGASPTGSNGDIFVNDVVSWSANNLLTLNAGGLINQTAGVISGALLTTSSVGGQTLNRANAVQSFKATNTTSGNIALTNTATTLTITGISNTATNGGVTVNNAGAIATSGEIGTNGGTISLTASGAMTVGAGIGGGMIALISGGELTESGSGDLRGTSVYAKGSKVTLTNTTGNGTGVIAGEATGTASGDIFSYKSYNGIQVTTINDIAGIQTAGGDVVLEADSHGIGQNSGSLINAGTGGLSLKTTGPVNLSQANTVGALTTVGAVGLPPSGSPSGFTFHNSGPLTVNSVTTTTNTPISITAGGLTTVSAPVTAGTGSSGTVSLTGVGVTNNSTITGPAGVTVNAGTGSFINTAGAATLTTGTGGRWLVYALSPSNVTKGSLTPTLYQYNTAYSGSVATTGSGFIYASPLYVDANFSGTLSNTYGSSPTTTPGYTLRGLDSADTITASTIAGSTVTYSNWPITPSTAAGSYNLQYSGLSHALTYSLTPGSSQTYTVNPAALTLVTAALTGTSSKTYDGTNTATLAPGNFLLGGFVNGDAASVTKTTGTYASQNVGSGILVSTTLTSTDFSQVGSTNLTNYTLPSIASGNIGSITPATLTVTAANVAKSYGQTPTLSAFTTAGLINGDTVGSVTETSPGQPATANVATYAITPSAATGGTFVLANYTIGYVNGVLTVAAIPLTVTAASASRIYGETNSTLSGNITGFQNNETSTVLSAQPSYSTAATTSSNVGSYAIIGAGAAAQNYSFGYVNGSLAVTARPITITADAKTKVYGQADLALTYQVGATATGTGLVGSDGLSGTLSRVAGESVLGGPYAIQQGSLSAGNNYSLSYTGNLLTITPASLNTIITSLTGTTSKTYDGTTNATLNASNYALSGWISGDGATVSKTTGSYTDKNAGNGKIVTVTLASSDYAATGSTLLSNYTLPTSASGTIGSITPASLSVSGLAAGNKVYDATTLATITGSATFAGLLGSDQVGLAGNASASFADKNVGTGKTVSITGLGLSGGDAANYTLVQQTGLRADITPAILYYVATSTSRYYGQANPLFTGIVSGYLTGDTLTTLATGTATFTSPATSISSMGQYPIDGSGLTLATNNYLLAQAATNATALTINQEPPALTAAITTAVTTSLQIQSTTAALTPNSSGTGSNPPPTTATTSSSSSADATSVAAPAASIAPTTQTASSASTTDSASDNKPVVKKAVIQTVIVANTTVQKPADQMVTAAQSTGQRLVCR